jgi:hypothetical protein
MSINYRYDDEDNAPNAVLQIDDYPPHNFLAVAIVSSMANGPRYEAFVTLPPDEQVKLFQAFAAHLTGTDNTPGLSYFTNWLTSFLSPDDLLTISHNLISHALAAKGEAGFAPGEPTENLGEWSEDEQT